MSSALSDELLVRQLEAWGFDLNDRTVDALLAYVDCLEQYTESNVIGTRSRDLILRDHVLDSLSCLLAGSIIKARRVVDVGSGGGLPGIPLKVFVPGLELALVEATRKKAKFLQMVAEEMALTNVEVLEERAEFMGRSPLYRGKYDVATARALASLPELLEYCVPLVRVGGEVVAMKARIRSEEMETGSNAASLLGAEIVAEINVEFLPEVSDKKRVLIVASKTSDTPEKYPRRTGVPKKHPLGER